MTNEKALNAFLRNKAKIDEAIERLQKLSADHFNVAPDDVHWGHVGDVADYSELLTQITDKAFNEGECAE